MDYILIAILILSNVASWLVYNYLHPRFGTLMVDNSDPEDVKMRLVIDKDIDETRCKYVTLKIEHTTIVPQTRE